MYQHIACPECGEQCNFVIVNGTTVSVCTFCYQAYLTDTKVILRLDERKLVGQPPILKEFLAVAMAMELLYKQWDVIAPHVPMAE